MIRQDVLRLALALFALIPLSYCFRYIQNTTMRYVYSLAIGLVVQIYVYGIQIIPIYVQSIIVFAMMKLNLKNLGSWVTLQSMIFLSGYHIYDYFYNYGGWTLNASTLLMIMVCKYSLLGYNIDDGKKPQQTLSDEQKKFKIVQTISFFDYLGYLNFLPTSLMGPPVEYQYYKSFMQRKEHYSQIPNTIAPTLKAFVQTCFFLGLYIIGQKYIPLTYLKEDNAFKKSFWGLYLYITASLYLLRCKYYFGWKLSISSVHASGVSYNGENFNQINTINPWIFETDLHIKNKIGNWNIGVQEWLRKGIYQRSPLKNQNAKQLYVFMISAFWHGFYQAYYISFFFWFVQLFLNGLMYKYFKSDDQLFVRIYKKTGKIGYYVLSFINMQFFNHSAVYMLVLETSICWKILKHFYFLPQIILLGALFIFMALPQSQSKKQKKVDGIQMQKTQ